MTVIYVRSYDGDIVAVQTDPLTAFYARHWTWRTTRDGYVHRKTSRRENGRVVGISVYLHRIITSAPQGLDVDHINRDTHDNRPENLRLLTPYDNRYGWARFGSGPEAPLAEGRPHQDETTPCEGSVHGQEVRGVVAEGEASETMVG